MHLTDRTERPRVIEILWIPWGWFDLARPGPIVTLGEHVAEASREASHAPWRQPKKR